MKQFDKTDIVKESWKILKKNAKVIAIAVAVYFGYYLLSNLAPNIIVPILGESLLSMSFLFVLTLVFSVIGIIIQIGYLRYFLKVVDGVSPEIKDLYSYPNLPLRAVKYFLASIIYALIILGGLILFIIPGIYLALRYQFYTYYIADRDAGIMDSLKMSGEITKGKVINLFLFTLLLMVINILGALALLVGLFITIPLSLIAWALLYRKLSSANPTSVPAQA